MFDQAKQLSLAFDADKPVETTTSGSEEPPTIDASLAAEITRRFKLGTSQTTLMSTFGIDREALSNVLHPALEASPEVEREVLARLDRLGL